MLPHGPLTSTISMLLLILLTIMMAQANPITTPSSDTRFSTTLDSSSSSLPWLQSMERRRSTGCSRRPLVCIKGREPAMRMACCNNRCVDVGSDVYNCGSCGARCPFPWQCCGGTCVDTGMDRSNCGECGNECPSLVVCSFGMCGYADARRRPHPLSMSSSSPQPQRSPSTLGTGAYLANQPPSPVLVDSLLDPEF